MTLAIRTVDAPNNGAEEAHTKGFLPVTGKKARDLSQAGLGSVEGVSLRQGDGDFEGVVVDIAKDSDVAAVTVVADTL